MSECTHDCGSCGDAGCGERTAPETLKPNKNSNIKKVIAIASGKGGVGKSLVTSLLAVTLQKRGYKVGILDGDITGPSIPKSFGLHDHPHVDEDGQLLPAVSKTGIKVTSTNMLVKEETAPFIWRGPVLVGMLTQFFSEVSWGELDYLLIDMPPGTGDIPMTVFQQFPIDGCVIVTAPQGLVSLIVEKAINMCNMMQVKILGIAENMSYFECPDCGKKHSIFGESEVEKIANDYHIGAFAQIPIDPKISEKVDAGQVEDVDAALLDTIIGSIIA